MNINHLDVSFICNGLRLVKKEIINDPKASEYPLVRDRFVEQIDDLISKFDNVFDEGVINYVNE